MYYDPVNAVLLDPCGLYYIKMYDTFMLIYINYINAATKCNSDAVDPYLPGDLWQEQGLLQGPSRLLPGRLQ